MIWLRDSALRYAAELCYEVPEYTVNVYTCSLPESDDAKARLKTFTKNKSATIHDGIIWHVDYTNGSCIKILLCEPLTPNARGARCHLAIVSGQVNALTVGLLHATELRDDPAITPTAQTHAGDPAGEAGDIGAMGRINGPELRQTLEDTVEQFADRLNEIHAEPTPVIIGDDAVERVTITPGVIGNARDAGDDLWARWLWDDDVVNANATTVANPVWETGTRGFQATTNTIQAADAIQPIIDW